MFNYFTTTYTDNIIVVRTNRKQVCRRIGLKERFEGLEHIVLLHQFQIICKLHHTQFRFYHSYYYWIVDTLYIEVVLVVVGLFSLAIAARTQQRLRCTIIIIIIMATIVCPKSQNGRVSLCTVLFVRCKQYDLNYQNYSYSRKSSQFRNINRLVKCRENNILNRCVD